MIIILLFAQFINSFYFLLFFLLYDNISIYGPVKSGSIIEKRDKYMAQVDIKYINPFVKATITVLEMLGMTGGKLGKPSLSDMVFPDNAFLIQVGVTGGMKGQVIIGMTEHKAKEIASVMMMGMPVNELDTMAASALGELGNMIMGNSSTIFSTMNIVFDITPPLSMNGYDLKLQAETTAIKIPIFINEEEHLSIYICLTDE